MNRTLFVDLLAKSGMLLSELGKKIDGILAKLFNVKPSYVPVPVKSGQPHPAFKGRRNS
jgi:hypothetical protein